MDVETSTYLAMLDQLAEHISDCAECRGRVPADYCDLGWVYYTAIPLSKRPPLRAAAPLDHRNPVGE